MKRPAHRPTIYTKKLGNIICKRIEAGKSLRKIVKDKKMPCSSTIFNWLLDEDKKDFLEHYEKAKNIQAENMFDELLEIADEKGKDVMRARLRVDTRKWYLSKVLPKKFGESLDVTSGGKPIPIFDYVQSNRNNDGDSKDKEIKQEN